MYVQDVTRDTIINAALQNTSMMQKKHKIKQTLTWLIQEKV